MERVQEQQIVIGVSSRALFDLTLENEIFETQGAEAYCRYQAEHEGDILRPGPGFSLVRSLLRLNEGREEGKPVEVIIMSRNCPEASLRIFRSVSHYGLPITRAVLSGGASPAPYLAAMHIDLFLSAYEDDVQRAVDGGIAAGIICTPAGVGQEREYAGEKGEIISISDWGKCGGHIRMAFDADAVLFTDESERIFRQEGLKAFEENERRNADRPLEEGPFAGFLKKLSGLQRQFDRDKCLIRTALVTSRCAPAHERVLRTLRAWDVRVDEAFFLGGMEKREVLKAFGAQIFFDDQALHTLSAAKDVPAARVPYRRAGGMYLWQALEREKQQ